MPQHIYTPLDVGRDQIRLLTLLPGAFADPVHIVIENVTLLPLATSNTERLSFDELKRTLPGGKTAHETPDGRYFFGDYAYFKKFWEHPDTNIPALKYAPYDAAAPLATIQYEALSYVWGEDDEEADQQIVLVDQRGDGDDASEIRTSDLYVRENLYVALQYLRYADKPRKLWIDAICINQMDLEERAVEVHKMARIYGLAQQSIVWLGPAVESTSLAMSTINYWASILIKDIHGLRCYCNPSGPYQERGNDWWNGPEKDLRSTDSKSLGAVSELLGRDYFRRLWVQQEIKVSARRALVICGNHSIPWASIVTIVASVQALEDDMFDNSNVYRVHGVSASTASDIYTLTQVVKRECADQRDKVYAVLALLSPELAEKIKPDYTMEVVEVYKQLCLRHIATSGRLELTFALLKTSIADRPSWIPDLSNPDQQSVDPCYSASEHSAAVCESVDPSILEVMAIKIGTVGIISDPLSWMQHALLRTISDWYDIGLKHFHANFQLEPEIYDDMFCDIVMRGQVNWKGQGTIPWPSIDEVLTFVKACREYKRSGSTTFKFDNRYLESFLYATVNTCFACFDGGLMGVLPNESRPGDTLCVILGAYSPVVLHKSSNDTHRIVGTAYIRGLMFGEALLGPLPPQIRVNAVLDNHGGHALQYWNIETGRSTWDPRQEPLPHPWETSGAPRQRKDPYFRSKFRNKDTGETINSDPRLSPEALKKRGVQLTKFKLV